ncbi:MAG: hypothetical protein JWP12_2796 [Bacteroidetes bacterium]|nr:hypothetical protein [Bacteroidota bacterium]
MKKGRLEAFSDGVIAIIITIMVLELKIPEGGHFENLKPLLSVFLCYILSFINIGIYWNNHHHLLHATEKVTGSILWANMHLLFWLSLMPFVTAWMGENHFAALPVAVYGADLVLCAIAYYILQTLILKEHSKNSPFVKALGKDLKGKISPILYLIGIPFAFVNTWISGILYITVAFIWLIPDKRIERALSEKGNKAVDK